MSEWKPIETAPKDGRKIMIYCPEVIVPGVIYLEEISIVYAYESSFRETGWIGLGRHWGASPTHWMPLPPPPKGEGT